MSIPHFKSQHDWEAYTLLFDKIWHCKKALLDRVKDDMFPGYNWQGLQYNVEVEFERKFPDYKHDDEVFIPYRSFKENVAEALKEALESQKECPPCDTLTCADHLTDE
jgi:hypothetical protein